MSPFKKFRKKIKKSIRHFIFNLADFRINKDTEDTGKTLVIIKNDLIGDYILFRNFLPYIRKSEKYKTYKIVLIGNSAWKNIAETLDADYYDEMIWISFDKLEKNLRYRSKTIKNILSKSYQTLFYPVYSGDVHTEKFLIAKITAKEKITYSAPLSGDDAKNMFPFDVIFRSEQEHLFEIYRYKEMFEFFLNTTIKDFQWRNLQTNTNNLVTIPEPYVVLFPGSNAYLKRWDTSNFAKVADYLLLHYPYHIILTGSKKDTKYAKAILDKTEKKYSGRLSDFTGKTSLLDLAHLISNSDILVTNDSAAIHMAATVNKEAVCIFMGENYGRFNPYPRDIYSNGIFICPPEVEDMVKTVHTNPVFLSLNYYPDINGVTSEHIIQKIEQLLSKKKFMPKG